MFLGEVTPQRFLSRGTIVARLCSSFGYFQNDYITFPDEWKEIKRPQANGQADCKVKDLFEVTLCFLSLFYF